MNGTVLIRGVGQSHERAVLSKRSPIDVADSMWIALSESSPMAVDAFHPALSLLQTWVDVVDPVSFARYDAVVPASADAGAALFALQPLPGLGPQRHVHGAAGCKAHVLRGRVARRSVGPQFDDYDGAPVPSASGNVQAGGFKVTAAMRQYDPGDAGYDGHFVVYFNDQARSDALKFIVRSVSGDIPTLPELVGQLIGRGASGARRHDDMLRLGIDEFCFRGPLRPERPEAPP